MFLAPVVLFGQMRNTEITDLFQIELFMENTLPEALIISSDFSYSVEESLFLLIALEVHFLDAAFHQIDNIKSEEAASGVFIPRHLITHSLSVSPLVNKNIVLTSNTSNNALAFSDFTTREALPVNDPTNLLNLNSLHKASGNQFMGFGPRWSL